jgi:hypothetical protein
MILTLQNFTSSTSELAFLHLNRDTDDWFEKQPKITDLDFFTRTALVETSQHQFLVVSSFNEVLASNIVLIYKLDTSTDDFVKIQQFPGENFDIILSINVSPKQQIIEQKTFLLLAREKKEALHIYKLKEGSPEFVFHRKIDFERKIVEVVALYINDVPYFIVSLHNGHFCLFEWRGIETWMSKQCGHFSNINQIKSYEYLKRQHLFLTSTMNTGTALTIYRQGERF